MVDGNIDGSRYVISLRSAWKYASCFVNGRYRALKTLFSDTAIDLCLHARFLSVLFHEILAVSANSGNSRKNALKSGSLGVVISFLEVHSSKARRASS